MAKAGTMLRAFSERITGFWLDRAALEEAGVTVGSLASWLVRYRIRDNVGPDVGVLPRFER